MSGRPPAADYVFWAEWREGLRIWFGRDYCPEAAWGKHSEPDRAGLCTFCRRRIAPPMGRPPAQRGVTTALGEAYNYFYDPDWGLP